MENEYFDIVDENNKTTGEKRLRSEAHTFGLWHRTVHIYFYRIIEGSTQLLVHLRSKTTEFSPNKWDTRFGGHLKSGESLEETVKHEAQEETGIELNSSELLAGKIYKYDNFPNREFTHVYCCRYEKEADTLHLDDGEVQTAKWMSIKDIKASMQKNPEHWSGGPQRLEEVVAFLKKAAANTEKPSQIL